VEMVEEDSHLFNIGLRLPSNLLNTPHDIVKLDGVGAKGHFQCGFESMEVLMVEDDILSFVTFEVIGRIFEYLDTVMLEESFLRDVMEGFVEYNIHDDESLPLEVNL
jgi:hypothetical protein